jgi:hypothetical protein
MLVLVPSLPFVFRQLLRFLRYEIRGRFPGAQISAQFVLSFSNDLDGLAAQSL